MSRCRSWIAIVVVLVIAGALATVALPQTAEAATTKSRLRSAKLALRQSQDRLKSAEAALSAAVAADVGLGATPAADPAATPTPTPPAAAMLESTLTIDELRARVARARHAVAVWKQRVRKLARHYQLERDLTRWERQHQWMRLIEVAAARYHVKADGMYRMMMRESGGHPYAGSGSAFKGLFQYWTGSWSADWNPWRSDSIYDGSAQIFATAYAIHKGMGPQMWTTTFASLY